MASGMPQAIKGAAVTIVKGAKKVVKEAKKIAKDNAAQFMEDLTRHRNLERSTYPYTMLLIGATGSGKTSFVNLMENYFKFRLAEHVSLSEMERITNLEKENKGAAKMESQTNDVSVYDFYIDKLRISVIDTPGFGDTHGKECDKENVQKIMHAIEKQEVINCVCLIVNGCETRMDSTLKYVLSEMRGILPKEIMNNIFVVFTMATSSLRATFDIKVLNTYFGKEIDDVFYIDNPFAMLQKAREKSPKKLPEKELKEAYKTAANELDKMCQYMMGLEEVSTIHFTELYNKKQEIEEHVFSILTLYSNQRNFEKSLEDTQKEIDDALQAKELTKEFRHSRSIEEHELSKTKGHNIICQAKGCYSNCHLSCKIPSSFSKKWFVFCSSHKLKKTCQECGHHYLYHSHSQNKFKKVSKTKEFIDESLKKQFEDAESQEIRAQLVHESLEKQLKESAEERKKLSEMLLEKIEDCESLGMTPSYAQFIQHLIIIFEGTIIDDELSDISKKLEEKLSIVRDALGEQVKNLEKL